MRSKLLFLLLLLALVLFPGPAAAHAALDSATPSDGSSLDQAPGQVRLTFTEPPDTGSRFEILGPGDRKVAASGVEMATDLPADLPDGTYQVVWQVISAADGHQTKGVTVFGVGQAPEAATVSPDPFPSPFSILGRFLLYLGLAVALGGAFAGLFLFRDLPHDRWLILAPCLILAGLLFLFWNAVQAATPTSVLDVAASVQGRWLVARLVLALFLFLVIPHQLDKVLILSVGIVFATVMAGHAAAPDPQRWLELAAQSVHVLVVGLWVGGLGWLLAGLRAPGRQARMMRFSRFALGSLVVVAVTGAWRAWDELTRWSDLWTSTYGQALLVKLGLLGLALVAASFNHWRGIPADDDRPLRLGMRMELALLVAVFLVTGLLSSLNPSRPVDTRPTASGTDYAGTTALTVTLARPGVLEATLTGADARTIELLAFHDDRPPKDITLDRVGPGKYQGEAPVLNAGGRWTLDASIDGVTVNGLALTVLNKEDP